MGHHGSKDETDGKGNEGIKLRGHYSSHMTGFVNIDGSKHPCDFTVTIGTDDVIHMIEKSPRHEATIIGEFNCAVLCKEPVPFSGGKFYVERSSETNSEYESMVYETLLPFGEEDYFFKGIRSAREDTFVGNDAGNDATDVSSMSIVIKKGPSFTAETLTTGHVSTLLADVAKELAGIAITGPGDDKKLEVEWKARLGFFLGGVIIHTSNMFSPTQFCPKTSARERRPLNLKGIEPEVYHIKANDGVPLLMTRYKCGNKGPILLLHGLCVTSRIFALDTIDKSAVEFFCEHGYDMWALEMRFSVALPSHRNPTKMHDAAEKDLPPVVDFILKTTESPDLQVWAHCVGSLTMHMAMLGGHIDGRKIRCFVASQTGFCIIASALNHAKASTRLDTIAVAFGFTGLNAYTDKNDHVREKMMTSVAKTLARSTLDNKNQCSNSVCHRITSMFGLMWEHRNINDSTHETLTEWFGFGQKDYYHHLAVCFRKGQLTDFKGKDIYTPDFKSKNRLHSPQYRKAMSKLDIPILYLVGSLNRSWDIEATRQSYIRLKEANPDQDYEWFQVPEYGHLDCVMGKDASKDVFPRILPFLEKYATPEKVWQGEDDGEYCNRQV
ncbi:uncharacterized protein LOC115926599 [Strongylocentrotus purpuratus]|uniref:Uncharacterized protein n=1 Tax=Strongylocentrotus purpuratus TaxID=7668 RepID=A0A7M7PCU4_STRPU|nr:uncharacterized protein LOC100893774 [Strongylocentrotus purpuratus]XP_030847301.1 uncharacterized protein LOC115926599 [Strongylocentrotus purpuratus]|eukprot:XP_003727893.1 PREDICTED: uncharacterized protein LOC100893774 [Strongylocentrotus purpuratus]